MPGRSRDLLLSEACLVGPALATFIAALSVRYHMSRARIREFLAGWFGVTLSVGTLDRCIREVGVACEPVVEDLLDDLRQAGVIHADETPWRQKENRAGCGWCCPRPPRSSISARARARKSAI